MWFGRRVVVIAVGAHPILAPGWSGKEHTDLALVDCDVHQTVEKMDDLIPYMSRVYGQQAREQGFRLAGSGYFNVAGDIARTGPGARPTAMAKHSGHHVGYRVRAAAGAASRPLECR